MAPTPILYVNLDPSDSLTLSVKPDWWAMRRVVTLSALVLLGFSVAGCTTDNPESLAQNDRFEPMNRGFFAVTQKVDKYFAKPVAQGYVAVVPEVARDGIHNFLSNLDLPITFGNNVLQADPENAGKTLGRFVVNTTIGVGGFIDVATRWGMPENKQDYGLTMGKGGIPEGDYLFLPFLGPSSVRDTFGSVVDLGMDPLTWIKFDDSEAWLAGRALLELIDTRSQNLETLDTIERTSVDFYATTRSLYRQHRNAQIHGGNPDIKDLPTF